MARNEAPVERVALAASAEEVVIAATVSAPGLVVGA